MVLSDTKVSPTPSSNWFPFHGSVVMRSSLPTRQTDMKKSHLLTLAVFVFLAFAAANAGKTARQKTGAANPFIDPGELGRHVTEMEKHFEEALRAQERQR